MGGLGGYPQQAAPEAEWLSRGIACQFISKIVLLPKNLRRPPRRIGNSYSCATSSCGVQRPTDNPNPNESDPSEMNLLSRSAENLAFVEIGEARSIIADSPSNSMLCLTAFKHNARVYRRILQSVVNINYQNLTNLFSTSGNSR